MKVKVILKEISLRLRLKEIGAQQLFWVQKCKIKLSALECLKLQTLSERRATLCLKFAKKCLKFEQTRDLFPLNTADDKNTRDHETYHVVHATTGRLLNSAVPQMQRALNLDARK